MPKSIKRFIDISLCHVQSKESPMSYYQTVKKALDLITAAGVLIAISPLLVLVALLILVLEGRPILYRSVRYVSPTRGVNIIKFRTMIRDATNPRHRLHERFMRDGYLDIPLTCEVFTPIGRILERLQIVELPQLFNILCSGMTFVGNRPLPHVNLELLSKFPAWEERFASPSGITGISQIVGKYSLQPRERLALEVAYSGVYRSGNVLKCDVLIALATLKFILLGKGTTLDDAWRILLSACHEPASLSAAAGEELRADIPV
jgi:lipopolysaccharide/colanic/teichoic acid biosynthesis glycosyltransferase